MIDKNELLKLLPKLIREDDEIKGAIITALSGVVATKEDIANLIEQWNRRFEANDKRLEELIQQMNKGFEDVNERINKTQEILITHSEALKNLPKDYQEINSKLNQLEHMSATQYKNLEGKIDTKFDKLNVFHN